MEKTLQKTTERSSNGPSSTALGVPERAQARIVLQNSVCWPP